MARNAPRDRPEPYEYVRRAYGVDPVVGARVRHLETGRYGAIARQPRGGPGHYVHVRFDGQTFSLPCHPSALHYKPIEVA